MKESRMLLNPDSSRCKYSIQCTYKSNHPIDVLYKNILSFTINNTLNVEKEKAETGWQNKIRLLVTCQRFGDLFSFGLVWKYSSVQTKYNKGRFKVMAILTCSSNITLSLPSYTGSALKRELNFCNGYLSLLYFWIEVHNPMI